MRLSHFFDWDGFKFSVKVLTLFIVATAVGRYGLLYASESHSPSLVLIQEAHPAPGKSLALSTTTSQHIMRTLTIADAVPPLGKLVVADLSTMVLTLYENGAATEKYPILATGAPGTPYETPAGFYAVLAKESDHFDRNQQIDLPWSVQFYGNYFIHGWPYAVDGSPVDLSYTGGDIRLSTANAKTVYDFADTGTGIFVYHPVPAAPASLVLDAIPRPSVSAASYLVADIDTNDVFLEKNASGTFPAAGTTKLVAALAANEMTPYDVKDNPEKAEYTSGLVEWMNAKAHTLDMASTRFIDANSTSTENVSTAEDLFRFASYLAHGKSFILDANAATVDSHTAVSVFSVPINGTVRQVAIVVITSDNATTDTIALSDWFMRSAAQGTELANIACITCAVPPSYRKIQL